MSKTKHVLQELCEDSDILVRSYSGRGMFGKSCLAVVPEQNSAGPFFASVLRALVDRGIGTQDELASEDDEVDTEGADTLEELAQAFDDMHQDSMGMSIVLYFPRIEFVDEEDEEEEEDEDEVA